MDPLWDDSRSESLGAEPDVKDPGFFIGREDLVDYGDRVNKLIRDMDSHLSRSDVSFSADVLFLKMEQWIPFKVEWDETYKEIPDAFRRGAMWTRIRVAHKKALDYREQFETKGVKFTKVVSPGIEKPLDSPAPPDPRAEERKEEEESKADAAKGGISTAKAAVGVVVGGLAVAAGFAIGKLVGIAYGGRR